MSEEEKPKKKCPKCSEEMVNENGTEFNAYWLCINCGTRIKEPQLDGI